jgi:hypothetical protein
MSAPGPLRTMRPSPFQNHLDAAVRAIAKLLVELRTIFQASLIRYDEGRIDVAGRLLSRVLGAQLFDRFRIEFGVRVQNAP